MARPRGPLGRRYLSPTQRTLDWFHTANEDAPPAQPWQNPLPERTEPLPDFALVRQIIRAILRSVGEATGLFTRLAWQCASSFRATDYLGGCNGARIRSVTLFSSL